MSSRLRSALSPRRTRRGPDDGRLIAVLAILIGLIPVVTVLGRHQSFGAQATIGLGLIVLGVLGLVVREPRP
jgi:hypothetical protein